MLVDIGVAHEIGLVPPANEIVEVKFQEIDGMEKVLLTEKAS